jgi:hypothetical protein
VLPTSLYPWLHAGSAFLLLGIGFACDTTMSEACLFLYEAFGCRKGEAQWETRFWQYESKEDVRMRVTTRHSLFNTLLVGMALLWIFSGCTHRETILESRTEISPVETKVAPRTAEIVHTVQWSGEYLSLIAKWYTGSSSNWKTLAAVFCPRHHRTAVETKALPQISLYRRRCSTLQFSPW